MNAARGAYYNEFDPYAAQWLRNLIARNLIPAGDVDERSIVDVSPADLAGFRQCHFFAGIGGWPLALRLAGFPDDREIWTGSCPCQPFSTAGKGDGFADERHLWPSFHWLIQQRRPAIVAGEQVASAAVGPWVDLVLTDLEALGYACGAYAGPAAGVGAPHLRDRSFWVADTGGEGLSQQRGRWVEPARSTSGGPDVRLADANGGEQWQAGAVQSGGEHGLLAQDRGDVRQGGGWARPRSESGFWVSDPLAGHWRGADWLACRDGKWRPVEPGAQPLVDGLPLGMGRLSPEQRELAKLAGISPKSLKMAKANRVGRLRGFGNAIVPQQAAEFIRAVMDCVP